MVQYNFTEFYAGVVSSSFEFFGFRDFVPFAFPIRQLVGLANRGLLLLKKRLSPKKEAVDMKG